MTCCVRNHLEGKNERRLWTNCPVRYAGCIAQPPVLARVAMMPRSARACASVCGSTWALAAASSTSLTRLGPRARLAARVGRGAAADAGELGDGRQRRIRVGLERGAGALACCRGTSGRPGVASADTAGPGGACLLAILSYLIFRRLVLK